MFDSSIRECQSSATSFAVFAVSSIWSVMNHEKNNHYLSAVEITRVLSRASMIFSLFFEIFQVMTSSSERNTYQKENELRCSDENSEHQHHTVENQTSSSVNGNHISFVAYRK
jgi:hypothetical protein